MTIPTLTPNDLKALRIIRNAVVHGGQAPSVRELQVLLGYKSPRSASDVLGRLVDLGMIERRGPGKIRMIQEWAEVTHHARTVSVPLVGTAPCGSPLLAEENVEATVPVSTRLARAPHRYFFLRAQGDSMNLAGIQDGDLVLVRQQSEAREGDRVVALIDDEATIKEYHRTRSVIVLRPRSTNKHHQPILLTEDFIIQGVVVTAIPKEDILYE